MSYKFLKMVQLFCAIAFAVVSIRVQLVLITAKSKFN